MSLRRKQGEIRRLIVACETEALKKLMDDAQYTQEQLAGAIGKPRATVAEALSLTNLPAENEV